MIDQWDLDIQVSNHTGAIQPSHSTLYTLQLEPDIRQIRDLPRDLHQLQTTCVSYIASVVCNIMCILLESCISFVYYSVYTGILCI